ncbi:MAG: hypothetical protein Q9207_004572, partial [Kuettlingeria erythrocarpa]
MKKLSSRNATEAKQKTPTEEALLHLCLGLESHVLDKETRFFLDYLESVLVRTDVTNSLDRHLRPEFHAQRPHLDRALALVCEVLEIYRDSSDLAIQQTLQQLYTRRVLQDNSAPHAEDELKVLIFNILGWVTLLFEPSHNHRSSSFRILNPCAVSSLKTSVLLSKSLWPLDELLRAFGDLLPQRTEVDGGDDSDDQLAFQVSYLSAATLHSIGKISIAWVDSLSAHLNFEPAGPTLYLFRFPSICKLQQSDDSILTILLRNLYVEGEEPGQDFSTTKVLGEILLSYALIFRDHRSSRIRYRTRERRRASFASAAPGSFSMMTCYKVDPVLDELCGLQESRSTFSSFGRPVRDSYDATTDFPVFRHRLRKVQLYMQGIQPNRFVSLWHDRRDLRLWYTIWTVIFLGVVSIVQSCVAIGVAAAQLRVA